MTDPEKSAVTGAEGREESGVTAEQVEVLSKAALATAPAGCTCGHSAEDHHDSFSFGWVCSVRGCNCGSATADAAEQLSILPKQNPDELIAQARERYRPVATFCLFSGGHDSSVLAHYCRDQYDALAFIDTGTAFPGVLEFIDEYAAWLGKPLKVFHPERDGEKPGTAWRRLVLEAGGFPGPAGHGRAYTRLKERAIERIVREAKVGHPRSASVMLLTGKRRAESARRLKTTAGIEKRGGQLYVNPLIDWTAGDMRDWRTDFYLPESPAAALLHRSGECNCGAFAEPGEREMLRSLDPRWFEGTIGCLEREAAEAGVPCRWGERPDAEAPTGDAGPLCSTCEWRQEAMEVAA